MNTLILGDTHGRDIWKQIVAKENPDRVVFIGDYFDSFNIPAVVQMQNFKDIIKYKETSNAEVIMLIGNHDYHYFPEIGYQGYSGYQAGARFNIEHLLNENRHHLQMAYQFDNILCTHAGVSSVFMDQVFGKDGWSVDNISTKLNEVWLYKPKTFSFNGLDPYGDDVYQTPIWIRPNSLQWANHKTLRKKIIQVVGHTTVDKIDIKGKTTGGRYYYIDCLETSKEYLIFNNNKIEINKI